MVSLTIGRNGSVSCELCIIRFKEKEHQYWEDAITRDSGHPRKVWKNLSLMMGRGKKPSASSTPSFTPGEYIKFLEAKVQKVRSDTANANPPTFETTAHVFSEIDQCTMVELGKIIKASPVKSCELDPIPTFLLLEFLDDLLPFLHMACNSSLSTGVLPTTQKRAIVTPVPKKHGLDVDALSSYRPISNLLFLSKVIEKLVARQLTAYLNGHDLLPKFSIRVSRGSLDGNGIDSLTVRHLRGN